jgi:hypothetical protein
MLRIVLTALAFLVVGASDPPAPSGAESYTHQQPTGDEHHANPQTSQRGTPQAPFVIEFQQAQGENSVTAKPEHKGDWYPTPEGWTAIFTGMLFLSTTGLWFFTGLMWCSARQTAKAIIDNERPWVGLKTPDAPKFEAGRQIFSSVIIHNSGRSPAMKMRLAIVGGIIPHANNLPIPSTKEMVERVLFPNINDYHRPPEFDPNEPALHPNPLPTAGFAQTGGHSGARAKAANPEPMDTGLWNMGSGFAAARRPGMTICCARPRRRGRIVREIQPRPYFAWKCGSTFCPISSMTRRILADSMPGQPMRKMR